MDKINRLLEERIELADYEVTFGQLPSSISKQVNQVDDEKESEVSSSSEDDDDSVEEVKQAVKPQEIQPKKVESDVNFFDQFSSRQAMPSFRPFGDNKPPGGNSLFGRSLYK